MTSTMEQTASDEVRAWPDDPGAPPTVRMPILRPRPVFGMGQLHINIDGPAPAPSGDQPGTAEFRYWGLAEALRRAADFWGPLMPAGHSWHPQVGAALTAKLDDGDDLNAFYDRNGLSFFHHQVGDMTVYSGESPDVVCHEVGHAVLDTLAPGLWDVASAEAAALHEAFGDISAILCHTQLTDLGSQIIAATNGRVSRSSDLSRLAEQLGWAIRQEAPGAVDPDCLRNAANRFFYSDPASLPPSGPAATLSSEPHSFSRIFSGAALHALAGMLQEQATKDAEGLRQAGIDLGKLLVAAAQQAPIVSDYFAQIAAHMISADADLFAGKYGRRLRTAFVRHGILSPAHAVSIRSEAGMAGPMMAGGSAPLQSMQMSGAPYGISEAFSVTAPSATGHFSVTGAAPEMGALPNADPQRAAKSFVEDLFRQGRVAVAEEHLTADSLAPEEAQGQTHEIVHGDNGLTLRRRLFD